MSSHSISGRGKYYSQSSGRVRRAPGQRGKEFWTLDTNFVQPYSRVMQNRTRKITITLEDSLARWTRAEAARKHTSVSRLLAGILRERMIDEAHYERAMREALARRPFLKSDGPYLSREATHGRDRDR
jgi:hypothetical protein